MSNYNNLKTTIDANIKQNGNQEITGPILNSVLNQMVNILGTGYQFAGVATLDPATDPGTPDAKVFYIANGKGTYTNFGGLQVTEDEVVVLYWDSSWHKVSTGIASQEKLSELEEEIKIKSDNLFNISESQPIGKIPNLEIGSSYQSFVNLGSYKTSNYIQVESGKQYCIINNGRINIITPIVALYANGILVDKINPASNPFSIPSGIDHIYISVSDSQYLSEKSAVKEVKDDMDYIWRPFGTEVMFVQKNNIQIYGVYKKGESLYHFVSQGNVCIIHEFKREGPNNLFQFSALHLGMIASGEIIITETIATFGTDIVGPISILRQNIDDGGRWAGGYHTINVGGVPMPTAEQESIKITINGKEITEDGFYYGEVNILTTNRVYFPQTVTSADFSNAILSLKEHRHYILNNRINVRVSLEFVADTRVILYYGMQGVRVGFDSIILPDDENVIDFSSMTSDYYINNINRHFLMKGNNLRYDMILSDIGLGKFIHNDGTSTYKYGSIPKDTRKVYQVLIAGNYDHSFISSGKILYWEGIYDIKPL